MVWSMQWRRPLETAKVSLSWAMKCVTSSRARNEMRSPTREAIRVGIGGVAFAQGCGQLLQQLRQGRILLPVWFDDGAKAAEFLERALQLLGLNRLEQVVDGVGFEGAKSVLIVGCREDDEGLSSEAGEQFEAVHTRHLDIEEEQVNLGRLRIVEGCDRRRGIGRSANDLNFRKGDEQTPQTFESQGLVVDEEGANGNQFRCHLGSSAGTDMETTVLSSTRFTLSCADSPKRSSSRPTRLPRP